MITDILITAVTFIVPSALLVCIKRLLQKSKGSLPKNIIAFIYSFVAVNWMLILSFRHWLHVFKDSQGEPFLYLMKNPRTNTQYFLAALALSVFLPVVEHSIKYVVIHRFKRIYGILGLSKVPPVKAAGVKHYIKRALIHLIILFLLLLTFSYQWFRSNFFHVSIYDIVITLSMPIKGMSNKSICTFINRVIIPSLFFCGTEIYAVRRLTSVYRIEKKNRRSNSSGKTPRVIFPVKFRYIAPLIAAWVFMLFSTADKTLNITGYIKDINQKSAFIENEYIWPKDVNISFPDEKRNLIYIYVESGESTLQDKASGGLFEQNCIPEMTELAKENINFSDSEKVGGGRVLPGCTNTVEGITAQSAGIPLKLGMHMEQLRYFMPNVVTVGDILEAEGYNNYFMCGSDLAFAGRDKFFKQHGNFECFDYHSAISEGKIDEDYKVWWGFEDNKLYQYAKEKITLLAASDQPFNFTMLTVDTHNNDGYVCELCENKFDDQYYNVYACASRQLYDFIRWIEAQDFFDNTTVIISGDHLSHDSSSFASYDYDSRRVYNCIINSPVKPSREKNRLFSTVDMFPTTLAALGAEIDGDKLGLGTNLFSERQTLIEEYGYDYVSSQLKMHSDYYDDIIIK